MKTHLLCTFVHRNDIELVLSFIGHTYQLDSGLIFVLSNQDEPEQCICTYNVIGEYELPSSTILIHRKSETNTLYTINALNQIIRNCNNGLLDPTLQLDWYNYSNTLVLLNQNQVIHIPLKLEKIHRIQ